MKYELAKELKDAGFPQDPDNPQVHTDICGNFENTDPKCRSENRGVSPTLDELIDKCTQKGRFIRLNQTTKGWFACSHDDELVIHESAVGQTPKIALARLWLELNRKKIYDTKLN